jgi:hypothetical protein
VTQQLPPQRVSGIKGPDAYVPPSRPPESAGEQIQDAYRQTRFVLGGDLDLLHDLMTLQLGLVKDAYQTRTHAAAAILGLWSRSYTYISDAALLVTRGSYASVLPLVRTACECIAASEGLCADEMSMHHEWLAHTLKPDERFKAFEFHLGRYFAQSVVIDDPLLSSVYRPAADLARPAFGATLLQTGPESNNVRVAITFADASFHLGWAEITLGWLLALAARQLQVIVEARDILPVSDERRQRYEALRKQADSALARGDRCRIEEVEDRGDRRYLVHNFRRTAGGAAKKILL